MTDPETVLNALAAGLTIEKAAKHFYMPADEVRKILHDEIERSLSGEHMCEAWALADRRLQAIELKFYNRALEGDGDPQAAMVFVKTSERRATLNGANMPQSHVLQVLSAPQPAQNSMERIRAAIDRLRDEHQRKKGNSDANGEDIQPH